MAKLKTKIPLEDIIVSPNLIQKVKKDDRRTIAESVFTLAVKDRNSRYQWEDVTNKVVELASLERKPKNYPRENASNVKLPTISTAVLQYVARAYSAVIRNGRTVGVYVIGQDPNAAKQQQARREADYMNYDLLVMDDNWATHTDKNLTACALTGVSFKKTYFDPLKGRNVSESIPYSEIWINNDAKSLEEAPRVTHRMFMSKNAILEQIRSGVFYIDDEKKLDTHDIGDLSKEEHEIYEQHCLLDLDGDGYAEPYVVTLLTETRDILRIIARFDPEGVQTNADNEIIKIKPVHYFTDFHCIPNPDGSYWSIGLGHLLYDLNSAQNTAANQLLDAGYLNNTPTGIADSSFRVPGGEIPLVHGKVIVTKTNFDGPISDHVSFIQFPPPSPILFQLLNFLVATGKELASISDATLGQDQVQNVATAVAGSKLAEGAKMFTSMQRRYLRGQKKEFEKLYRLHSIFLDKREYARILGEDPAVCEGDFGDNDLDIRPVADPELDTDAMKAMRSEVAHRLLENPTTGAHINSFELCRTELENVNWPSMQTILIPPDPNAPPPIDTIKIMSDIDEKSQRLQLDAQDQQLKDKDITIRAHVAEAEIALKMAQATLAVAQANSAAAEPELARANMDNQMRIESMKTDKDALLGGLKSQTDLHKAKMAADSKPKPSSGDK